MYKVILSACSTILLLSEVVFGVELTFELRDSSKDCFYQEIQKNTSGVLEYQVNLFSNSIQDKITKENLANDC